MNQGPVASVAPEAGLAAASGSLTRSVASQPDESSADAAPTVSGSTPADVPVDAPAVALESFDSSALEFTSSSSSSPWEEADKQVAPDQVAPAYLSTDPDTMARVKALAAAGQSCPDRASYTTSGAPSKKSAKGVAGTTTADLVAFAEQYNLIRYQNCLPPVKRFVYDSCMEARLFWMAESPSPDPLDAWGHIGSTRVDGVPSVGCDGNLAGGTGNTGTTVATKWWQSLSHRASLYRPPNSTAGVCVALAMTHGGIDEPTSFTRAAASWRSC